MNQNPFISKAVEILKSGGLVAFPTETVYGLGADARNEKAIQKIFVAKGRPADHPLIVHLGSVDELPEWVCDVPKSAIVLAEACWPGPLTLIMQKHPSVLSLVTGGQETIGVRIPSHPIAQALLKAFGSGIAAPSANRFTHLSPTTREAVQEELGEKVDLILDGGACEVGVESTILDVSGNVPVLLRPGMITQDSIAVVLRERVFTKEEVTSSVRASGMHVLHYAPMTPLRLMATQEIASFLEKVQADDLPLALVTYSDMSLHNQKIHHVTMPSDAALYAKALYATLRGLDQKHLKSIVIEAVPAGDAWEAIRDRLKKGSRES